MSEEIISNVKRETSIKVIAFDVSVIEAGFSIVEEGKWISTHTYRADIRLSRSFARPFQNPFTLPYEQSFAT